MDHIKKLSKSYRQVIAKVVLLKSRITELEGTVAHLNKKKRRSKARLPVPGTESLTVERAQDLIARKQAIEQARQDSQPQRSRAPRTCSNCHQIGHYRTRCHLYTVSSS
jgi:hypothetical protein